LVVKAYKLLIPIVSSFSLKVKLREKSWETVLESAKLKITDANDKKKIWIHSASMGEFEQAKPIIEKIKSLFPDYFIVCSFFSPSGYENQKNYQYLDVALYLPIDEYRNVKYFLDTLQPHIALFVRYEIWLNYLKELKKRGIPVFLVNATAPSSFVGRNNFLAKSFYRKAYSFFNAIFPLEEDKLFFSNLGIETKIIPIYDTRFDRVHFKIEQTKNFFLKKENFENYFVLVAGSIWKPDAELLVSAVKLLGNKIPLKVIYVPHEPDDSNLSHLKKLVPKHILLSELITQKESSNIKEIIGDKDIIVDSIGHLLDLYSLADVAYVGGGFGVGIHSVVEPAGYFLPIACGGNINASIEAKQMNTQGILEVVESPHQFADWIYNLFSDKVLYENKRTDVKAYFTRRLGSTAKVVNSIFNYE
jgi:3-deoxy-D-manno-octulosonic-acid transferase